MNNWDAKNLSIIVVAKAIGCFVLSTCLSTQAYAEDPAAEARWRDILALREAEDELIISTQYDYTTRVRHGTVQDPVRETIYRSRFAKQDQKLYFDGQTEHLSINMESFSVGEGLSLDVSDPDLLRINYAYDGTSLRIRRAGAIARSRRLDHARPASPLPHDALRLYSIDRMREFVDGPRFEVTAAESTTFRGDTVTKITFGMTGGNTWLEVWYDTARGAYPVEAKSYTQDGTLVGVVRDVKLQEIEVDGNTIYYPVAGILERFDQHTGESMYLAETEVSENSLRVNEPVPDEIFTLERSPHEMLYDMDLEMVVINPANEIDLSQDFSTDSLKNANTDTMEVQDKITEPGSTEHESQQADIAAATRAPSKTLLATAAIIVVLFIVGIVAIGAKRRSSQSS